MCVQKTELTRATEWPKMTEGLVDEVQELRFKHDPKMDRQGHFRVLGANLCLWPNTVVDRGRPLAEWLPGYDIDLNLNINTDDSLAEKDVVVYASSVGVNNAWFPGRGLSFWNDILHRAGEDFRQTPTLIGARWDDEFSGKLTAPHKSLLGKTNLPQIAGVIKNARIVIGIISGMTILANHFGTPCVAIYPDKFPPGFPTSWTRAGIPYEPVKASEVANPSVIMDAANHVTAAQWTTAR